MTSVVSVSESDNGYQLGYLPTYAAVPSRSLGALHVPIRRGTQRVTAAVTVVFAYAQGTAN